MEAAECLEQIYDYIARDNPTAAHKVVAGIYEKIQSSVDNRELATGMSRSQTARSAKFSMAITGFRTFSSAKIKLRSSAFFTAQWILNVI